MGYLDSYMDLATARKVAQRPQAYRPHRWSRALSVLMRWAAEPCYQREYDKRLRMCRRLYELIGERLKKLERERQKRWRPKKSR